MKAYRKKEGALMHVSGGRMMDMLAHDLRTPMCCVSGAAQMALAASRQGKDVDEQVAQILQAVETMDRMLAQMCSARRETTFTAVQLEQELRAVMQQRAQRIV